MEHMASSLCVYKIGICFPCFQQLIICIMKAAIVIIMIISRTPLYASASFILYVNIRVFMVPNSWLFYRYPFEFYPKIKLVRLLFPSSALEHSVNILVRKKRWRACGQISLDQIPYDNVVCGRLSWCLLHHSSWTHCNIGLLTIFWWESRLPGKERDRRFFNTLRKERAWSIFTKWILSRVP